MGLRYTLTTWAVLTVGLAVFCNSQKMKMIMKMGETCSGSRYSKLPIRIEKLTYTPNPETGSLAMSGTVVIEKNISKLILELEIRRCITDEVSSCTKFIALNCTNICEQMGKKGQVWSTVYNSIQDFPEKCPIPGGRYEMRNGYINLQLGHELFGIPRGHWMTRLSFLDKEEVLFCHWNLATVKPSRKRKPKD